MKLAIAGAPDDTGNLGVTALLLSALYGIRRVTDDVEFVVFDYGRGQRERTHVIGELTQPVTHIGAVNSRRLHRSENIARTRLALRCGVRTRLGEVVRSCDAVLDVTGGDSYSDIYGQRRFAASAAIKQLALECGRPLVLLPQTYGPFRSDANRARAERQIRRAALAVARDPLSFAKLTQLRGDGTGGAIEEGVDMAFGLPAAPPPVVPDWVAARAGVGEPLVGVNVSGLLASSAAAGALGVDSDAYMSAIEEFIRYVIAGTRRRVVLIPHVLHATESDVAACNVIASRASNDRVCIIPPTQDPTAAKWWVSQCEFMIGARMHATIAALSTGVPAVGMAYSDKFAGVFAQAGAADGVVDIRGRRDPRALADDMIQRYEGRDRLRTGIQQERGRVTALWEHQFESIMATIGGA